jgi:hypothetical protein
MAPSKDVVREDGVRRRADNLAQYHYDRYHYTWDQWLPARVNGRWRWAEWNDAGIAPIRSFDQRCRNHLR